MNEMKKVIQHVRKYSEISHKVDTYEVKYYVRFRGVDLRGFDL